MKTAKICMFILAICLICIAVSIEIKLPSDKTEVGEETVQKYYTKDDFESIVVGETTFQDTFKILHLQTQSFNVTAYGGYCEYPMQNGGFICIKFSGPDMIVFAVDEIPQTLEAE